jgi:hypothetical protein
MPVYALILLVQSCVFLFYVTVFDRVAIHKDLDVSELYVGVWQ